MAIIDRDTGRGGNATDVPATPSVGFAWPPPEWNFGSLDPAPPAPPVDPNAADVSVSNVKVDQPLDASVSNLKIDEPAVSNVHVLDDKEAAKIASPDVSNTIAPTIPGVGILTSAVPAIEPEKPKDAIAGGVAGAGAGVPDQRAPDMPAELRTPDELAKYYEAHPDQKVHDDTLRDQLANEKALTDRIALEKQNQQRMLEEHQSMMYASQRRIIENQRIQADADRISQIQLTNPRKTMGTGGKVLGFIGSVLGGASGGYLGTGRNPFLEEFNKSVDQDVELQKANLANQWKGLDTKRSVLGDEYAAHQDIYRAEQAYRMASMQSADRMIEMEKQKYDSRGRNASALANAQMQLRQQMQTAQQAQDMARIKMFKDQADAQKALADAMKAKAEADKLNKANAGGTGGGMGAKGYGVALNIADPFSGQPLYGKRALKPEEEKEYRTKSAAYARLQNAMAEMRKYIDRGGAEKSFAEKLTGPTSPERQGFESARANLILALAEGRVRGNLSDEEHESAAKGQAALLEKEVPDAEGFIKQMAGSNPRALLEQLQDRSDRDFTTQFNGFGVNGDAIIAKAQTMRGETPVPTGDIRQGNAARAGIVANTPSQKKDADAARDEAMEARTQEIEHAEVAKQATEAIHAGDWKHEDPKLAADKTLRLAGLDPESAKGQAAAETIRKQVNEYNLALREYEQIKPFVAGKNDKPGDVVLKRQEYDAKVRDAAAAVAKARDVALRAGMHIVSKERSSPGLLAPVAKTLEKKGHE